MTSYAELRRKNPALLSEYIRKSKATQDAKKVEKHEFGLTAQHHSVQYHSRYYFEQKC